MMRVAIVGGGISGLAAAIALQLEGHEAKIFERAPEIREVGSGLTLWSNATRVLNHLGILDFCLAKSCPIQDFYLMLTSGRQVMRINIEEFATAAIVMHRADLHSALLKRLPSDWVETNAACSNVQEQPDGMCLTINGRLLGPFDLVIGADGVKSVVRHYVTGSDTPPRYRGYYIWRGVAPLDLNSYPAGRVSETWGYGHRFGILPMGNKRVCWYATANQPLGQTTRPEERKRRVLGIVGKWHDPIPSLVDATPTHAILENPAFDRGVKRGWSRAAAVLIGDAAHPITPNLGQGGCMALEDAVVLAKVLSKVDRSDLSGIKVALQKFESLRYPRLQSMERRCRILGAMGQWQHPVLTAIRNRVAALLPGQYFQYTSRTIQKYAADAID